MQLVLFIYRHSCCREIPPSSSLEQQPNSEHSYATAGWSYSSDRYLDFSTQLAHQEPGKVSSRLDPCDKRIEEQSTGLTRQMNTLQCLPMASPNLPQQGARWSWKDRYYYTSQPLVFLRKKDLKELFWSSGQKESEQVRVPERVATLLSHWNIHRNKQLLEKSMGKVLFY